jgi:hypothetical protein
VTEEGIVMLVRPLDENNESVRMLTDVGICTDLREEVDEKAYAPIDVTDVGICTD